MKKQLLFFFLTLLPLVASADIVKIDGIYYNLISKGGTQAAEVTSNPNLYSGNVIIPEKITYNGTEYVVISIGNNCFSYCKDLLSITMPNSITTIGDNAFIGCSSLTSLSIPISVTSFGHYAFASCDKLEKITIPNSVVSIGGNAFNRCNSLTTLIIPNSVKSIGDYVCSDCSSLKSVTISNKIDHIGTKFFKNCHKLESIIIPNGVLSIGDYAFQNCSIMTSITIPPSITSIGGNAFLDCKELKRINISDITSWCKINFGSNPLASSGGSLYLNGKEIINLIIPNDVNTVNAGAFTNCGSIISVTLGEKVVSIRDRAFSGCSKLNTVTIGNNVTSIGYASFYGCSELSSVIIGGGMRSIGSRAFENCSKLSDVYCYALTAPEIKIYYGYDASSVFKGAYIDYATLHVPAESVNAYKATEPWQEFKRVVSINGDETPDPQKCEKPTIRYENGEISFSCETEGVQFISSITDSDIKDYTIARIPLNITYTISVYATKAGYEDSDFATATLCWIDKEPSTEGVTSIAQIRAKAIMIQNKGNVLTIQGADENTPIGVYEINGTLAGTGISRDGTATVNTNLRPSSIAIVKIGDKSVKVMMK